MWYCQVTVPITAGLIVSTGSDPSGIGIYTAQLGKPKSVFFSFTFFHPNLPQLLWHSEDGPISNAFVMVSFNNYCEEHPISQYAVRFEYCAQINGFEYCGQSKSGSVSYANYDSCVTTLRVLAPSMDSALNSTATVTPNGDTEKAFSFDFSFVERLNVEPSLSKAIVDSQPEITLTVFNLVSVSDGELCEESSCGFDHNLVITFGQVCNSVCCLA